MIIKLENVRCSFLSVFKVDKYGKFSCDFLLDPENKKHAAKIAEIEEAIEQVAEAKWGGKSTSLLAQMGKQERVCFRDGDDKPYDGYEGMMYIHSSNDAQPLLIDRDKTELLPADGKLYGGCYVNGSIELWAQDHGEGGKRINASLRAVQYFAKGDSFSGGSAAKAAEFDDLGDHGEDEDDLA